MNTGSSPLVQLLERSRRLAADPRNTNYGGGNTSAKGTAIDPVTGEPVEVLWVKGSGGDLATLSESGVATLRLDRLRALVDAYRGVDHEDEMVAAFDHCLFGRGGAVPSIDTPTHALVEADHVNHLHPDAGLAFAVSADGESLTHRCFGDRVGWVPWRRPGFQLGVEVAAFKRDRPDAIGVVLGGHGITAWGDTSERSEANALEIIRGAEEFIRDHGRPEPFGPVVAGFAPLPADERRTRAAALMPVIRTLCSSDRRVVGYFDDSDVVLDFLSRQQHPRLVRLGTSCPDHFIRTRIRPLVLDLPTNASEAQVTDRLRALHAEYREEYAAYYARNATPDSPALRGADPTVVLVPGIGMFGFGPSRHEARITCEFYVNAINAIRGAEALSRYTPISEHEKFRIEYWWLEEDKLQRLPKPRPLSGRVALVTAGASVVGCAVARRLVAEGACVVVADPDPDAAERIAGDIGGPDEAASTRLDTSTADQVQAAIRTALLTFGGLDIVVGPDAALVAPEALRVMEQETGGDIVDVFGASDPLADGNDFAAVDDEDRALQRRRLAAGLRRVGIRLNGVGLTAQTNGASRTAASLSPEEVAAAAFAFLAGDLSLTTGALVTVDPRLRSARPR